MRLSYNTDIFLMMFLFLFSLNELLQQNVMFLHRDVSKYSLYNDYLNLEVLFIKHTLISFNTKQG